MPPQVKPREIIPEATKRALLERYSYRCANRPGSNTPGCVGYKCPMWAINQGLFDESAYHIDHIDLHAITRNNGIDNLQVLCPCCHSVKSNRERAERNSFTSREIESGSAHMRDTNKKRRFFENPDFDPMDQDKGNGFGKSENFRVAHKIILEKDLKSILNC